LCDFCDELPSAGLPLTLVLLLCGCRLRRLMLLHLSLLQLL